MKTLCRWAAVGLTLCIGTAQAGSIRVTPQFQATYQKQDNDDSSSYSESSSLVGLSLSYQSDLGLYLNYALFQGSIDGEFEDSSGTSTDNDPDVDRNQIAIGYRFGRAKGAQYGQYWGLEGRQSSAEFEGSANDLKEQRLSLFMETDTRRTYRRLALSYQQSEFDFGNYDSDTLAFSWEQNWLFGGNYGFGLFGEVRVGSGENAGQDFDTAGALIGTQFIYRPRWGNIPKERQRRSRRAQRPSEPSKPVAETPSADSKASTTPIVAEPRPANTEVAVAAPPAFASDPVPQTSRYDDLAVMDNSGEYMSPFTSDDVTAQWVDKAINAEIGSTLGATAGTAAGVYAGRKVLENIPFIGGWLGGKAGQKIGDKAGRNIAIKASGGWDYIRSSSDISFRSLQDMALWLAAKHGQNPKLPEVLKAADAIYPGLQDACSKALRSL